MLSKMRYVIILLVLKEVITFRCDRRPYGSATQASPSDGRFRLTVLDVENNAYIPDQLYTVQISETDGVSRFMGFMISAEGDTKPDPNNPRRTMQMFPGDIKPMNPTTAKFSDRCLYSVEHAMNSYKSSVEVYWQAPPSGSGCVTIRAMVVENSELWYEDGSPLTEKLCEDMRQPDDVAPQLNYDCQICDEAKYEVSFTGVWSRNTHPRYFPENDWLPRYSDLIGASHVADLIIWAPGSLASEGLKDLAEYANSSKFEAEIREKIGDGVRTLIKGKGHGSHKMNNPTYAFFRTDKNHHLLTVALGIFPSPDWFLGVTRFELCQDNAWLPERELNLYPWDAGTDSGVSYESPNIPTFPQDAVERVAMSSYDKYSPFYETDIRDMHPFGKLHIKLIRTYHRDCEDTTEETPDGETSEEKPTEDNNENETDKQTEPEQPSRYQNPEIDSGVLERTTTEGIPEPDPESSDQCPMTAWTAWSECEGACDDGKIKGYQWRERYHLVDGHAVEKYDPTAKHPFRKEVSKYCKKHFEDFQRRECEEDCSDSETEESEEDVEIEAERRIMSPVVPGGAWNKRRELYTVNNN